MEGPAIYLESTLCPSFFRLVQMGCYGIGVSRILATLVEIGHQRQEDSLVWPQSVAPYLVCIVSKCKVSRFSLNFDFFFFFFW